MTSEPSSLKQRRGSNPPEKPAATPTTGAPSVRQESSALLAAPIAPLFDNGLLWASQKITVGINLLGFVISLATGSHLHLDLLGTGAFFASVLPALGAAKTNGRIAYSSFAVSLWSIRLAAFLFYRALVLQHDARLTTTLSTVGGTFGFWFISAIWGVVTALPHALGTTNASHPGSAVTTGLGLALFAVGWGIETMADLQKWAFKQSNPGAFCNVGLWKLSQHPNWFGDLLLWSGIFILNFPAFIEPCSEPATSWWAHVWSWRRVAVALLSPLFLWFLFSGEANGTITDAFSMANKRYGYGVDAEYTKYIDSTPEIIPFLPKGWPNSRIE